MSRILVTGSRDWTREGAISSALLHASARSEDQYKDMVLVVGDCPTGADAIALGIWDCFNFGEVEVFTADWNKHGYSAGPKRNNAMVASGAEVCLAFIIEGTDSKGKALSRGSKGCANAAEKAGIRVVRFIEHPDGRLEVTDTSGELNDDGHHVAQFDNEGPTPSLNDFKAQYEKDDNVFWLLGSDHHQNLLDEALCRIKELEDAR